MAAEEWENMCPNLMPQEIEICAGKDRLYAAISDSILTEKYFGYQARAIVGGNCEIL